uniref:Transmembrane protein (PGPGW) n=1 Tax=uncultured Thiotrichaceae bacterium TaxID=298394 RepID=A0A6S6SWJ3_9GAMM|nr:MAG: Unknown protein [uncultured Thiotrichaceae bacterium]
MIDQVMQWFQYNQSVFIWTGIFSAVTFVLSLLMLPWLLKKIPTDYFTRHPPDDSWALLLTPRSLIRNFLGFPVLLAGISMLILPGQGFLTILLGLAIMQFPGKFTLERWVIGRPGILQTVNWVRRKSGTTELEI